MTDVANQMQARLTRNSFITCAVLVLILVPLALLIILNVGYIEGEEFSPDDFSKRRFQYNHIFGLNLTIEGNKHTDSTSSVARYLVDNNLITVVTPPKKWHLVSDSRTTGDSADFDAKILVDYLDQPSQTQKLFWLDWTMTNPDHAAVFWPVVAQFARDYSYLAISEIMRFASNFEPTDDNLEEFERQLKQVAAEQCWLHGTIDIEAKRLERAVLRLTRSIEYQDSIEARKSRAIAYQSLGQAVAAELDLKAAESLNDNGPTK